MGIPVPCEPGGYVRAMHVGQLTALVAACGDDPSWVCRKVLEATDGNEALANLADGATSIGLIVIATFLVAHLARRYISRITARVVTPDRNAINRRLGQMGLQSLAGDVEDDRDEQLRRLARATSISSVVAGTAMVVIWVIALLLILGELGVNLGPLIAGAGLAGAALTFGAQSLIKDCISGLFVLIEDQYGIGDHIDMGEATGTVEEITLRATVLRGVDGTVWHVPNGEVQRVGNMSQLWSVALVDIDVAYDADLERAGSVILDSAREICSSPPWTDSVLEDPELLGVEMLGADGITLRLVTRTTPGAQWGLQRAMREGLKSALDEAGVEIPFPQRTVWLRTDSA
jgi:small conductance mechanosensitive channel